MTEKHVRKKIILGIGLILIAALFYFQPSLFSVVQKDVGPRLRVIFLDVGQGDAALIISPSGRTILVDGGPDDKVLSKLGQYLPFNQRKIDTMILSHAHADHVAGLTAALKRYQVGEVYYNGVPHTSDVFLEWLKLIKEKQIPMKIVNKQEEVDWGEGIKLLFLYPNRNLNTTLRAKGEAISPAYTEVSKFQQGSDLNNTSIVFKLIYGKTSFLFTGDVETLVEEELLACHSRENGNPEKNQPESAGFPIKLGMTEGECDLRVDVLKVAHHGSHSSTSEDFLKAVQPQMAVISSGAGNDFGHPRRRTLRRLERYGVKIYRTDELGDVEIKSDGDEVKKE